MSLLKLKKKFKEIIYGTIEWQDAVKEVAKMLDQIDKFFWDIGRIAIRIPDYRGKGERNQEKKSFFSSTPLQQFAKEVQELTKRYKNIYSCYQRIVQARKLCEEYEPEEVHEELPINHHVVASRLAPVKEIPIKGKTRDEWLDKAEEEKWSARELAEKMQPTRERIEYTSTEETYQRFSDTLINLEETMDCFIKNGYEGLSQTRKNGMVRSLYIFISTHLPKFLEHIEREGNAKLDPIFKEFVKKTRGGLNEKSK